MDGPLENKSDMKRIAIVSEPINLIPMEGIRKFSRELSNAFEKSKEFEVYRVGFSEEGYNKGGALAKINEILGCRRILREIDPDTIIYIPSSPRIMMNLLKFRLWRGKSKNRAFILLQPPNGAAPFANRILRKTKLFRQFDLSQLPHSLQNTTWRVIPSGVNTEEFKPASKDEKDRLKIQYGFAPGDRIAVSVGHLTEGRNLNLIMKISESIDAKTVFVCGELKWNDPDIKARLKTSGVIVFDQYLERIQDIYSISDCYIFPTRYSGSAIGMPLSILEALSCNVPVVSTSFGIVPEILNKAASISFFDDDETAIGLVREIISEPRNNDARETALNFDWGNVMRLITSELSQTIGEGRS